MSLASVTKFKRLILKKKPKIANAKANTRVNHNRKKGVKR